MKRFGLALLMSFTLASCGNEAAKSEESETKAIGLVCRTTAYTVDGYLCDGSGEQAYYGINAFAAKRTQIRNCQSYHQLEYSYNKGCHQSCATNTYCLPTVD